MKASKYLLDLAMLAITKLPHSDILLKMHRPCKFNNVVNLDDQIDKKILLMKEFAGQERYRVK